METLIAAAALALAAAQDADAARRIDELIRQLGADDYAAREEATEELRKIGKPAEEALKKAAESPDAEVRSRAKDLLKELEGPPAAGKSRDEVVPRRGLRPGPGFRFHSSGGSLSVQSVNGDATYRLAPGDGSPPFTFHRAADGRVRLEYEDDEGRKKTVEAASLRKFLEEHKDLAAKFGISEDGIDYGGLRAGFGRDGMQRAFRAQPGFRFRLDELLPRGGEEGAEEAAGASFEKPSEALRAQLGIQEGQGLVVTRVAEGGPAWSAGLRRHDVVLEIDGKKVGSAAEVEEMIRKATSVTVLRKGRMETVRRRTGAPGKGERRDF